MGTGTNIRNGWLGTKIIGATVTDAQGNESVRVTQHDEITEQLIAGRVLLCQVVEQDFDVGESIEIAFKSDIGPVVLLGLDVNCQAEEVTVQILEGGSGLTGGDTPLCLNPNRVNIPAQNTEIMLGTPSTPITGISGIGISEPWRMVGVDGFAGSDYVSDSIDVGGFICAPSTWYQITLTNTGTGNNRRCNLNLKFIDPS